MIHTKILGTGSHFPTKKLTNHDLAKMVDTSDEWIRERTGISSRWVIDRSKGELNSKLALGAARKALEQAGVKGEELDLIIVATVTPDHIMPTMSCMLQNSLNAKRAGAVDLSAACSGFVYGLTMANALIKTGQHKKILVLGSEALSGFTDWEDRNSCILFGDGAGAFVLGAAPSGEKSQFLSCHLHADGSLPELFHLPAGGTALPASHETVDRRLHFMQMNGRAVFKEAVRMLVDCAAAALEANQMSAKDLDWFVPHQANIRIIEAVAKRLDFPMERVILNISDHGNTSSATCPTAFDTATRSGKIKRGQTVLFDVFGAGLTYGSLLLRY